MTNNEQAAAHRILQKHGIEHKLQGYRLPLASNEFAIGIADRWFYDLDDVRKYMLRVVKKHYEAEIDLRSWQVAEYSAEVARINARCP